jgi:nuclear pore complex protein Nup107
VLENAHIANNLIAAPQRRKELRRIRQTFIPDLVLRLHTLLFTHRKSYPHLLQQALDLTKIVADEDNHCYEEFFGRGGEGDDPFRLIAYLERVREAGMAALEAGSGSAFVGA